MTTDIRISVEFWDHPKTIKLEKHLGLEAVKSLQILWIWAAKNRPDGVLVNMDDEDVELAAKWSGETGKFTAELVDLNFLESHEIRKPNVTLTTVNDSFNENQRRCSGVKIRYSIHSWRSHNPWAAESKNRSEKARFSRLAYVCPEIHSQLLAKGQNSITKDEYEQILADFKKMQSATPRNKRKIKNE
jgi:hypothetical protein